MDATGQLCNCFWSDAKCRMDYGFFGDVLVFDTTFETNEYDKPFAPFVGVNNHGQTTLFRCALLLDESTYSFVWLFKTFLNAMNGKHTQTIFTDQAAPIMNAIKQVFPNTHHRLCLWHIFQLAAKHLSHIFARSEFFAMDFKRCIYENGTEEEFDLMWKSLLKKYKLTNNKWLKILYKKKEKWAQVYGRLHFCAGMTTTQRSEGMNSFLKKYFKRTLSLKSFVIQYDKVLTCRRDIEKAQNFRSTQKKPPLQSHWPLEARASELYTTTMFAHFQKEYTQTLDLIPELVDQDGPVYTYKVTSFKFSCARIITFNSLDNFIQCSCKHFQFMGMICSHSIKILHTHQVYDLLSQYYLSRWTVDAKNGVGIEEPKKNGAGIQGNSGSSSLEYSDLARMALSLAVKGTSTGTSSAFTKKLLTGVLGELDNFLKSTQDDQAEKIINVADENNENMGQTSIQLPMSQTSIQLPMSANITLRAPPRSKKSSKKTGRIKSSV
ncbi:protein FAR1-RELATED SEQUENCE 5-like [Papaver somniferum]|uniref:protein FAR1-RELATED SEQUENCE 5-like n=1 Tax=Papaver somniferum TaxID=3469 RepID=UPI000E6F5B85|nr:protein FAR1-RELATED SEQUENCE 5-like [Papaver somniferum]